MQRCDFIDWMKAIGMFLIVFGHFFGDPYNQFTQPIYPKQIGVALFVFIMGWGLGKESKPRWQVAYNRVFPMYFWGTVIALFISAVSFIVINEWSVSNYAPLLLGVNVGLNNFPSNPTTWFIGTYIHIVLLWALVLYRVKVSPIMLITSLIFEILVRATLIEYDRLFTAYMVLPNWLTIFLLGMYMCNKKDSTDKTNLLYLVTGWGLFLGLWALVGNYLEVNNRFPLTRGLHYNNTIPSSVFISILVSALYIGHSLFFVSVFSKIKASRLVRFFSRNTIIVFIAHMPFYAVAAPIASLIIPNGWGKRLLIVLLMYVGLSLLSELLSKIIRINLLRDRLWPIVNRAAKRFSMQVQRVN